jgi:L-alanine-DL-glutamate epimerase-like enolase superfamily enzyme
MMMDHTTRVEDPTIPGTAMPALTVTRVEVIPVIAPLARVFKGSFYKMDRRATLITRLYTEEGIVGEAYAGDEVDTLAAISAVVTDEIAPRLIGMNLMSTARIWEACYPATFDILRDRRIGLVAMAGVDAAMWDAFGKALGMPLHRLWGGYRDAVPMIAIGGYYGEPLGAIEDEMATYQDMGLAGVKFKVGGASPAEDAARVRRARAAAGDDFVIAVDANQGYSVNDAIDFARRAEDLNIRWFEEPVGWANDRRDLATVRQATRIPVAAGQSELSPSACRDLMEAGSIDVCNFDASWSGGPTAWLKTAAVASTYSVQMAHHEEPQVSSHLIGSQAHGTYSECFHPDRDPFWWNLIANRPELENGYLPLPTGAGLGWELNTDYIDAFRVDGKGAS